MSHDRDVLDAVREALSCAPDAAITVLGRIEGPYSSVRRVSIQTPTCTLRAYIKVMKPRRTGADELARVDRLLEREYLATEALHSALQRDARLGAVRPLAWLPRHHAIVTEEVPGRPLGELLSDVRQSTDELASTARSVGAWVRVYQGAVRAGGVVELAERRAYLDERLKLLEGRVLSSAERAATLQRFDQLAALMGSTSVPAVAIHADLSPLNIIVAPGGRTTVLDFTMAKTGTTLHDLAHLYFHLGLLAAKHPGRRDQVRVIERGLLEGYSPSLSERDPLFRMMLLQHSVCHLAMLAERRVPVVDVAYRWFMRRRWQMCQQMPGQAEDLPMAGAAVSLRAG